MPLHVSSTRAHHQEVKIALHSNFCASSCLITEINIFYRSFKLIKFVGLQGIHMQ